jgi:hypothetical protein
LVPEESDRFEIVISYDPIVENTGGSAILKYYVYVDDGLDGLFEGPYTSESNGMTMKFSTNQLAGPFYAGRIYRFKYSSENIAGESEISEELSVLLAEVPKAPTQLHRIDSEILPAG